MSKSVAFKVGQPLFSPEFQDMIDRCVDLMKLDIVQGLAYEQEPSLMAARGVSANPSRLAPIVAARLRNAKPGGKRGRSNALKALPLTELYDASLRSLSRRYNVDLTSTKRVVDQIDSARDFAFIALELRNEAKLSSLQENIFAMQVDEDSTSELGGEVESIRRLVPHLAVDPTVLRMMVDGGRFSGTAPGSTIIGGAVAAPIVVNKGLYFRLQKVKCIDETNPEWPGDDEIAMGGTAVPPSGNLTKVPEFMVRDDFDDGESTTYSPPRLLKTFSLTNVSYPADFLMVLALAEKDNGGMSQFLQDLWEAIKDEVTLIIAAVGAAARAAIGLGIGGAVGTAIGGPLLGTIIGAVAGAILGALIGWLISAIKDDIFTPQSAAGLPPTPQP
ncbi:MAG: hypothetical protein EAZ40_15020 [Rhodobacterales bacterium]|nr:MAG: hypothetical protein EAZ40_15020 [Rhodobacterales bacterium]